MSIQELREIIEDDLKVIRDLIAKAEHRMEGIEKSLDKLEKREDETNKS